MNIVRLTDKETESIFREHLPNDFQHEQIKPLDVIKKLLKEGSYIGYSIMEREDMIGYAFVFESDKNCVFLDYFAILEPYRNKGLGGEFIDKIYACYGKDSILILEAENPEFSESKVLCEKRIAFYERNGVMRTRVRTRLFDYEYMIMCKKENGNYTDSFICKKTADIYRKMISEKYFNEIVFPYLIKE